MIQSLHISNYALIDTIDINLHNGLNIVTGETGAGKSIILGALSLLLGGRADNKAIRNHDQKSVIEATFTVRGFNNLKAICEENDIDWDDDTMILRREMTPAGRSRAFVNDCPVNLAMLQQVALSLIDIHSQHQNLLLASPPYQLRVLDSLAGNDARLQRMSEAYGAYRQALKRYNMERRMIEQAKDDEEFMRFQYQRLADAKLQPGEQEELEHERELLVNMAEVKSALTVITSCLTEGEENAESISDYDRSLAAEPGRLDEVEERLNTIYDLERRYKAETVEALIAHRDELKDRLRGIEIGDETLHALEAEAKQAKRHALELAAELSKARHDEAKKFAGMLIERAVPLGMKNLRCEISVKDTELSVTGTDQVEFLFSFNKNQPLLPVGNTASGGEISRLMLSIKSIVADKMQLPSIIFDEVDTGVSGDVANKMGEMMQQIAANIQVLAITHLPQVAAKGSSHYKVYKEDTADRTITRIKQLTTAEREGELALMLSGSAVDETALAAARSLLWGSGQK